MIEVRNDYEVLTFTMLDFCKTVFSICGRDSINFDLTKRLLEKFCKMYLDKENNRFGRFKSNINDKSSFNGYEYTHKIIELRIENNELICKLRLLDTVCGKDIKELVKNGFMIAPYFDEHDNRINITEYDNVYFPRYMNVKELFIKFFGENNVPRDIFEYEVHAGLTNFNNTYADLAKVRMTTI